MSKTSDFFDNYLNIGKIMREKREYRDHMKRVDALPEDYQYLFKKIQSHMWQFAAGNGYDMMKVHYDLIDLFESGAAEGAMCWILRARLWLPFVMSCCAARKPTPKTGGSSSIATFINTSEKRGMINE